MATIENLGAAYSKRIAQQGVLKSKSSRPKRASVSNAEKVPTAKRAAELKRSEEALKSRGSSERRGRAIENVMKPRKPMTTDELAEMLRKVNLTFDIFEIQARFNIDRESGEISVLIINQRTGEVIRRIPPYDIREFASSILNGEPFVTDMKA